MLWGWSSGIDAVSDKLTYIAKRGGGQHTEKAELMSRDNMAGSGGTPRTKGTAHKSAIPGKFTTDKKRSKRSKREVKSVISAVMHWGISLASC